MASGISGKAQRENVYGRTVTRAAAALPQTASQNLFTVSGGRVLITTVVGQVTTAIGAVPNATKLQVAGTGGVTSDMCATVEVSGLTTGNLFGITGNPTSAAVVGSVVPQPNELVALPGTVRLNTAGSSGTGAMSWVLTYIPLDDGAVVTAV